MTETVFLKVTSAFLANGLIAKPGEVVEVAIAEAKDLLHRGKAEVANESDAHKVAPHPLSVGETIEADEAEEAPAVATEVKTRGRKKGK